MTLTWQWHGMTRYTCPNSDVCDSRGSTAWQLRKGDGDSVVSFLDVPSGSLWRYESVFGGSIF
ncbi:hypothetical protein SCLCIDRAFT_1222769 [Scleroderma citrinum Foug A]|uniref:Uncharacterized protein n=1 Tax=Scleroderma citrinum Foug A TaxID=1036808 RepID=A0A0C2ZLB5_9AGAM|nr:hypothetical protein SCLCIDRAFT_1222769 [Scleroderma citrinum Foug A]